ncbi:hypothetical protein HK102_000218, partial [Quaeritorhiza haematococci]
MASIIGWIRNGVDQITGKTGIIVGTESPAPGTARFELIKEAKETDRATASSTLEHLPKDRWAVYFKLKPPTLKPKDGNTHQWFEDHGDVPVPTVFNYPLQKQPQMALIPLTPETPDLLSVPNDQAMNAKSAEMVFHKAYNDRLHNKKKYTDEIRRNMVLAANDLSKVTTVQKNKIREGTTYEDVVGAMLLPDEVLVEGAPILDYYRSMIKYGDVFAKSDTYYKGKAFITNKRILFVSANTEHATTTTSKYTKYTLHREDTDVIAYRHIPLNALRGVTLSAFIKSEAKADVYGEPSYGVGLCMLKTCCPCCIPFCCPLNWKHHVTETDSVNLREVTLGFQYPD